jgi:23S rRNA (cytosine1962-C5)-methyltransferase
VNKTITLKKNEDNRILSGHLWAFSNEIGKIDGEPTAGDLVTLRNHAGRFIGIGTYNPHSLIAVRVLTREEEEIDFHFFHKRITTAAALRKRIFPTADSFRLIHGEGDFLPGLIVDKYADFLSVQTFSAGMERRLTLICDVLESLFHPTGIVERNESPMRALEGLETRQGILRGSIGTPTISEYGIKYAVDLLEGQKTGFFLDQRENRKALRKYVKGSSVLDCFCHDGGFALHAAYAEATNVLGIDVSESAIRRASNNATLNGLGESVRFVRADCFEFFENEIREGRQFDVVNLDPPSFAKNKKSVTGAKRGYKELHTSALRLLPPGGILSSASCSHHITEETFLNIINDCARGAGRVLNLLEWRGAPPDHPVLPAMPETRYLKFGIFQIH